MTAPKSFLQMSWALRLVGLAVVTVAVLVVVGGRIAEGGDVGGHVLFLVLFLGGVVAVGFIVRRLRRRGEL